MMNFPHWRRGAAGLALIVAIIASSLTHAQSVLSEPDFSGMNSSTSVAQIVARDGVRGWNYVSGGGTTHINGIQIGAFARVNDYGQLDLSWTGVLPTPFFIGALLLGNGELMFREGLLRYPPWQRLRQGPNGGFLLEPFRWTNEALVQDNAAATARDRAGNTYAVFMRQSASGAPLATLRRVTSEGVPDTLWRLDIDADSSNVRQLAISADGSVFYVTTRTDGTVVTNALGRASTNDSLRWTATFGGAFLALATDAVGRAYLLGDKVALQSSTGTLLRVDRTGNIDAGWIPLVDPVMSTSISVVRVLDDRAVVVTSSATERPQARLISLADGHVLASRFVPLGMSVGPIDAGGTVVLNGDAKLTLWSPVAADFITRDAVMKTGRPPAIASIQRWGTGYVVGGTFEYAYNSIHYANLMRLGADLKPDPTWRPAISGTVNALAVDRDGGLLVGGERLLDAQTGLIRFTSDGRLDPQWRKSFNGAVLTVTAATDGAVFVGGRFGKVDDINAPAIARFRADGALLAGWAQSVPWRQQPGGLIGGVGGDGVKKIIDAGAGGVVVTWDQTTTIFGGDGTKLSRFSRANDGAMLANSGGLDAINANTIIQDTNSGQIFGLRYGPGAATLARLLPITLEIDPVWVPPTAQSSVAALTNSYLYLTNGRRMLRSTNSATPDADWTLGARSISGWLDTATPGDGLMWSGQGGGPVVIRTPSPAIEQRTVVEYFAKNIQRFFITARVAEQQHLDAMPTEFVRTGMQFGTFDGAVVPPAAGVTEAGPPTPPFNAAGALPICRFYAPPILGGSNTHFYGRRTECQLLNTYPYFVNEGYDFAAPQPSPLSGACPENAPTPVYRLFNDLVASNNGNHRYVVSQARINEMKARGWVDEGIAFCAMSATDSGVFGQW